MGYHLEKEISLEWQVVAQSTTFVWTVVWAIVWRSTLEHSLCLLSTSGPTGTRVSRSRLASSLVVAYSSSQSTSSSNTTTSSRVNYPINVQRSTQRRPRSLTASLISVCIRPHPTHFSLSARIYTFVRPLSPMIRP